jgi:LEA14-like dessication related protein
MYRLAAILALAACHPQTQAQLRVIGARKEVVYVQVTNPESHSMRLDKLDYKFAADHGTVTVAQGELPLDARVVPAGATAIVEVPLDADSMQAMTMTGELTAELDEIVRTFQVSAQIQPH